MSIHLVVFAVFAGKAATLGGRAAAANRNRQNAGLSGDGGYGGYIPGMCCHLEFSEIPARAIDRSHTVVMVV